MDHTGDCSALVTARADGAPRRCPGPAVHRGGAHPDGGANRAGQRRFGGVQLHHQGRVHPPAQVKHPSEGPHEDLQLDYRGSTTHVAVTAPAPACHHPLRAIHGRGPRLHGLIEQPQPGRGGWCAARWIAGPLEDLSSLPGTHRRAQRGVIGRRRRAALRCRGGRTRRPIRRRSVRVRQRQCGRVRRSRRLGLRPG